LVPAEWSFAKQGLTTILVVGEGTMSVVWGVFFATIAGLVGGLAIAGVLLKVMWIDCPSWLSVGLYLALGHIVLVPAFLILPRLDLFGLAWLVGGGLAYSVGAVVYLLERPDPWPKVMGHHEIWHLFVLAGAGAHFVFVWSLLDQAVPAF